MRVVLGKDMHTYFSSGKCQDKRSVAGHLSDLRAHKVRTACSTDI